MQDLILIGLFAPLVGFLALLCTSNRIDRKTAGIIGCSSIMLSFLCFALLLYTYTTGGIGSTKVTLFHWISLKTIQANFSLELDHVSLLMTLIITGVGLLIHLYSNGYMNHDAHVPRFFACMNLFIFAMLLLVLADNLLLLFVGWEGVGVASYLLIGFWHQRPSAAAAAIKAFVVNRIGDLGLILAIILTFYLFGTGNMAEVNSSVSQHFSSDAPILIILTLLFFVGATGKSAQLPLHTWLPDAMEGPAPVSALIHAATMVTAGVYLIVRMHAVFLMAPTTMYIIAVIGGCTAIFAAVCAIGQTDLKRVLAYSTVSQLGYMFLATGVGAFYAALFHLMTHAFVKATLFLSAGNVVHMTHEITDMRRMGGLGKKLNVTTILFLIGVLALSGIPPLSAFFSKELILEVAFLDGFKWLFYVGLTTAVLTAYYLIRTYVLTFTGKPRLETPLFDKIKEAPKIMLVPVSILALLSIGGGFLGFHLRQVPFLESFLDEVGITPIEKELSTGLHLTAEMWFAVIGGLLGVGASAYIYSRYAERVNRPILLLKQAFYVDELYNFLFVKPLKVLSKSITEFFEPHVFDGLLTKSSHLTMKAAHRLQRLQSGQMRSYVAWMAVGMVFLIAYFIF